MAKFRKFNKTYDKKNTAVSVVQLDNFNNNNIVKKISYDNLIIENSTENEFIQSIIPISETESYKFKLTHYLANANNNMDFLFTEKVNKKNQPVFFQYQLKFDVAGIGRNDLIQIYKNNNELIDPNEYIVEYAQLTLYDNYLNGNDPDYSRYGSKIEWNTYDGVSNVYRARILLPMKFFRDEAFYMIKYNKNYLNVDFPTHMELLELVPLYDSSLFIQTYDVASKSTIIDISTSEIVNKNLNNLYVVKDPNKHINMEESLVIITDGISSEASSSWNVKINTGNFIRSEEIFDTETSLFKLAYSSADKYKYQIVSYIKPKMLGDNIVKLSEKPIYIAEYNYPEYNIRIFPNMTQTNALPLGSIGLTIDEQLIKDLSIASIDRYKGYIMFNKNLKATQEVSFFVYIDFKETLFIQNLELNPRITAKYGLSSKSDVSFKEIGIAIRKAKPGIPNSERKYYYHPYFYDTHDPTKFYLGDVVSNTNDTYVIDDAQLIWDPFNSVYNKLGEFLPIGLLSLNRLSLDLLKITDARVIGGGIDNNKLQNLTNNQDNSYSDNGYFDGVLLPYEGLKIIHIPKYIYEDLINKWKNSGLFNETLYTDITQYEIDNFSSDEEQQYYSNLLQGMASNKEDRYKNPFVKMKQEWAEKEASYYIDRLIKKYISAGTQYILLDENFEQIKLRLD